MYTHTHTHTHTHSQLSGQPTESLQTSVRWQVCESQFTSEEKLDFLSRAFCSDALCNNICVCIHCVCVCVCLCVCTCGLSFSGTVVLNTGHTLQLTRWPLTSHLYTTTTLLDTLSRTDVQYWPQTNTLTNTHTPTHSFTNFCLNIWVFWQQIHTARIVFYDIFLISGFIFHVT